MSTTKNGPIPKTETINLKKPLFAAMVIDKSGSMRALSEATVDGFNEYLAEAQRETPDAIMSVTLFDDKRIELHVADPIARISPLTEERYHHGGMGNTALNDALGAMIVSIESNTLAKDRRVLVAVTTDGLENASTEWSRAQVAELVKKKESEGWKFVFFGANIDTQKEGGSMSIPAPRSVSYSATPAGTAGVYRRIARASSSFARGEAEEKWTSELSAPDTKT